MASLSHASKTVGKARDEVRSRHPARTRCPRRTLHIRLSSRVKTPRVQGFVFDDFHPATAWLRESASVRFPSLDSAGTIAIEGDWVPHPEVKEALRPRLEIRWRGRTVGVVEPRQPGPWRIQFEAEAGDEAQLEFLLKGLGWPNTLAWLGRVSADLPGTAALQRHRAQNPNRQLRVARISWRDQEVFDFSLRHSPFSPAFGRQRAKVGVNIIGYFTADLGIGESARCMLRTCHAAGVPATPIEARLPCKASRTDATYKDQLKEKPEHAVNLFHLDAPAAPHIDTHHGPALREGRYNIGYLAWELPEFPDAWMPYLHHFDEIWCPSEFVRQAIAEKSPVPVHCFPHAIAFARPVESTLQLRTRLGLPADRYLFLFLYDLHSYSERKNAKAVIEAFRLSGLAERGASLIVKVHGVKGNEADLARLRESVADLPGTVLLTETFSRREIYDLEAACDCFVSLHRSEGFGLAIAEAMYLGKPVIATDWSASTEFLNEITGCPVRHRLVMLENSHGPYSRGQFWADPDVTHAAEWMVRLHDDPSLGHLLGTSARSSVETQLSPGAIGARVRRRLETIASW